MEEARGRGRAAISCPRLPAARGDSETGTQYICTGVGAAGCRCCGGSLGYSAQRRLLARSVAPKLCCDRQTLCGAAAGVRSEHHREPFAQPWTADLLSGPRWREYEAGCRKFVRQHPPRSRCLFGIAQPLLNAPLTPEALFGAPFCHCGEKITRIPFSSSEQNEILPLFVTRR